MRRLVAFFSITLAFFHSTTSFADCSALINDAISWANKRDGSNRYYVGFQLSTMKAPTKFVHFSEGSFVAGGGGLYADRTDAFFSDRTYCPNPSPGTFCVNLQKFGYQNADKMSFTLTSPGNLKVVLNTWGNATYNINLQCSSGFLYGTLVEPNGSSFVTMNLKKYSVSIPR